MKLSSNEILLSHYWLTIWSVLSHYWVLTQCWFNAEFQNSYCPLTLDVVFSLGFFAAHCFTLHIFYSNCIYICSRKKSQMLPMGNELTIFSISFWSSNLLYVIVMLILLLRPSVEKCAQINQIFLRNSNANLCIFYYF